MNRWRHNGNWHNWHNWHDNRRRRHWLGNHWNRCGWLDLDGHHRSCRGHRNGCGGLGHHSSHRRRNRRGGLGHSRNHRNWRSRLGRVGLGRVELDNRLNRRWRGWLWRGDDGRRCGNDWLWRGDDRFGGGGDDRLLRL